MANYIKHGEAPYKIAVIHGGPGAPGSMKDIAKELSNDYGIIEPHQTSDTIVGTLKEMKKTLKENADFPITLIGWSWGAWLSCLFAWQNPEMINKLILVGSAPFEKEYVIGITETRLKRLPEESKQEVLAIMEEFNDELFYKKNEDEKKKLFAKFGSLMDESDTYDPIEKKSEPIDVDFNIFSSVWAAADELRYTGDLLKITRNIKCSVVVIHGDYDPHPYEGIDKPLKETLDNYKFYLLKNCGHTPWYEKQAKKEFYDILKKEITN